MGVIFERGEGKQLANSNRNSRGGKKRGGSKRRSSGGRKNKRRSKKGGFCMKKVGGVTMEGGGMKMGNRPSHQKKGVGEYQLVGRKQTVQKERGIRRNPYVDWAIKKMTRKRNLTLKEKNAEP